MCKTVWVFYTSWVSINGELKINNTNIIFNRINYNGSLIGSIPETEKVMNDCAENKIYPQIQIIKAEEINVAWKKWLTKKPVTV